MEYKHFDATDLILVTCDNKGINYNAAVMTYNDFMTDIVDESAKSITDVHEYAKSLFETQGEKDKFLEVNGRDKKYQARYAYNRHEIKQFLQTVAKGIYDDRKIFLDLHLCSRESLNGLYMLSLQLNGENIERKYDYKKVPKTFKLGEIFKNSNGRNYEVLKTYPNSTLFLKDVNSGQFVMAYNTNMYAKVYSEINDSEPICEELAASWDNGDYLGYDLANIDFERYSEELVNELSSEQYSEKKLEKASNLIEKVIKNCDDSKNEMQLKDVLFDLNEIKQNMSTTEVQENEKKNEPISRKNIKRK